MGYKEDYQAWFESSSLGKNSTSEPVATNPGIGSPSPGGTPYSGSRPQKWDDPNDRTGTPSKWVQDGKKQVSTPGQRVWDLINDGYGRYADRSEYDAAAVDLRKSTP